MKKKNNDVRRRLIGCYLVSSFLIFSEIGLALLQQRTQAASFAVSLLNFEPKVSKFPVLEATRLLVLLLLLEVIFYLLSFYKFYSKFFLTIKFLPLKQQIEKFLRLTQYPSINRSISTIEIMQIVFYLLYLIYELKTIQEMFHSSPLNDKNHFVFVR